jgi:hypothetical protein
MVTEQPEPRKTTLHGIPRPEWERRFHARIAARAVDHEYKPLQPDAAAEISAEELQAWPTNSGDWPGATPEDAADEQMSNWLDDQEP